MRRFHFSLETVRSLREDAEQRAQQDFAQELAADAARRSEAAAADARLDAARDLSRPVSGAMVTADVLRARQAFVERCEREQAQAEASARAQGQAVERRRMLLEIASRDRKALERLKEHHREAHVREELRRENAELADITLARPAQPLGGMA
ncbi:MAG: flagellar protein FliJ [Miltoncostaeaceae bacterium]|jgi:flagellar FliJ protein|nr:flagellar protein FliJ [Miltoncostaeaceae bacterium]